MHDDPVLLDRQAAYVDQLRALGRPQRTMGLVASLVGVLVLVVGRYRFPDAPFVTWTGAAVIGFGWACFVYAVARRYLWMRAHPFNPNAPLG